MLIVTSAINLLFFVAATWACKWNKVFEGLYYIASSASKVAAIVHNHSATLARVQNLGLFFSLYKWLLSKVVKREKLDDE